MPALGFRRSRRVGFHLRLMAMGIALVILVTVLGSVSAYTVARQWLEESQQRELLAIVNSTASHLNGDLLSLISRDASGVVQGQDEFDEIQAILQATAERNQMVSRGSPLYVMRPTVNYERTNELEFVVMAGQAPGTSFVGNTYVATPHLREALRGRSTTSGLYRDSEGAWISAAAPVHDSRGLVVALLQADRSADWFDARARDQVQPLIAVALVGMLFSAGLAYVFAQGLVNPVRDLVTATQAIADGHLDHRVAIRRRDELGDLATSVNAMAGRLEVAQAELLIQQQALSEALATAQQASQAKSDFLATMSHELRTPLNAVIGYSEILLEEARACGRTTDEADLSRILHSARHLLTLIVTVLDYAKLEAERVVLESREYEVDRLIEHARAVAEPLARKNGNTLELSNGLPGVTVCVDEFRLHQCLLNLLGNACKFTERGTVRLAVSSEVREGIEGVRWAVTDTGPGIGEEHQRKLFAPFSQVDSSMKRRNGGTGLGLALTARLCRLMGGDVSVTSREGEGSTFAIWLPRCGPPTPECPAPGEAAREPALTGQA